MAVAADLNPAKNESYLTFLCSCEIHLWAMGSSFSTNTTIRATMTTQIQFIPAQQPHTGWEQPYQQTCSSPQDTSLWDRVETCRAGIMLRCYWCCLDWTPLSQAVKQTCTFDIKSMNCKSTNGRWFSKGIFIASRKLHANCLKRLWKFSKTAQHRPRSLLLV